MQEGERDFAEADNGSSAELQAELLDGALDSAEANVVREVGEAKVGGVAQGLFHGQVGEENVVLADIGRDLERFSGGRRRRGGLECQRKGKRRRERGREREKKNDDRGDATGKNMEERGGKRREERFCRREREEEGRRRQRGERMY